MNKWHINKKGVPALCKATKGKCPLGEHFDTEENAQNAISEQMEGEFGLLPQSKMSFKKKKDMASLIQRISGIKSAGFDYEIFTSLSIAEEMGLEKVAITDKNGLTISLSTDNSKQINADVFVDRSIDALDKYYRDIGAPVNDKSALARVVYHSDDLSKGTLVQSGGSNVLDAAIIQADEVVDIIEVKRLNTGAQLPALSLEVDRDGSISEESLSKYEPYIQNAIRDVKIQDADGSDVKIDFGDERLNEELPLRHFVQQYKEKGATSFIYTTDEGNTVNRINLTGPTDEIIKELKEKKIEANIRMRANLNTRDATDEDIYRFNNLLSKEYFKSGRASTTESFTLKGIKEDKIKKSGKYVRVGGYVLPIEYDSYEDNLNKRIKKKDLKAFRLVLTGNIKTNY